jgi:DNA-binding winged helix-turn-helix (wHTH) protein/Tol biopolymer transport system component
MSTKPYTFGPFRFEPDSGTLRKYGVRLKLQRQPAQILKALLEDPGKTVSRSDLHSRLWPQDTFVDFDQGLNVAIRKLRDALGDSADRPSYIATEAGIGYRFVAPVVRDNGAPSSEPPQKPVLPPVAAPKPHGNWNNWARVAIPVCSIGIFLVIFVLPRFGTRRPRALQAVIPFPAGIRLTTNGENAGLSLSPDGGTVAFSAIGSSGQSMLWLRRLDSLNPALIPGTETGAFPFWSPDGGKLGFFTDLELRQMDLRTGRVSRICAVESGRGAAWTSGGDIVFAPSTRTAIYKVSENGGEPIPVTHLDGEKFTTHRWPSLLPDEKHFVYLAARHDKPEPAALFLGSLDGSREQFIAEADTNAIAVPGALLFLSGGKLLLQKFNQSTAALDAGATVVAEGVDYDSGLWLAAVAIGGDSLLFRKRPETGSQQTISWFDGRGKRITDAGTPGTYRAVALAPNGRDVAVLCGDPNVNLCIVASNGTVTNVVNTPTVGFPVWSLDSSSIAYGVHDSKGVQTVMRTLASAGPPKVLIHAAGPLSFHPDGHRLLVYRGYDRQGHGSGLSVLDLRTGEETEYLPAVSTLLSAQFSPDGRWVAYSSLESGADAVYVTSFPRPSLKYRVSLAYGNSPHWRGDGRKLYFLGGNSTITAVTVSGRSEELLFGTPRALFRAPIFPSPWDRSSWDVSRDGSRFVVNTVHASDSSLVVVTNWRQQVGIY